MVGRLRLRFLSGSFSDRDYQLFYDWHLALRGGEYGHIESLEPWKVVPDQEYHFTKDSVEFSWMDFATKDGLAEAARDLGGMVVEEYVDEAWQEVRCWKPKRDGIIRVVAEQQELLRED